jgi:predicted alpha/beta hydrolase family esterase
MKRAVILHGTDGSPESNWFPWLKGKLETRGYEVWVPALPGNHTPNRRIYNDFLFDSKWDFSDNLIIGHSSGAVSVLNLLGDKRCPHIKTGVLVGAWSHTNDTELDSKQFQELFPPNGFDFDFIKSNANHLFFMHGDDDPNCPIEQAKWLAEQMGSEIIIVPDGGHLNQTAGFTELPQLINALEEHNWL